MKPATSEFSNASVLARHGGAHSKLQAFPNSGGGGLPGRQAHKEDPRALSRAATVSDTMRQRMPAKNPPYPARQLARAAQLTEPGSARTTTR